MHSAERTQVLESLAERILHLALRHPVRVGVSGITASGKSTFSDGLAEVLRQHGRPVIRASIDQFHRPAEQRYRQGRSSPIGYYEDAHDYAAIRELLLEPLGPSGHRRYRLSSWDLKRDAPPEDLTVHEAPVTSVLVVDGTFLFKPQLNDCWDFRIFLDTRFDAARARGVRRDQAQLGSAEKAEKLYLERYHVASQRYLDEVNPSVLAQAIVWNDDPMSPRIIEAHPSAAGSSA